MAKAKKHLGFSISEELLEKLKYIAQYDYRSASSVVRRSIVAYVDAFEREHGEISLK